MIKKLLFVALLTILSLQIKGYAQFINFQITVEPEIKTSVEQELNFGSFVSNSGIQEINLGDFNMGVFSIRALHTQNLFLILDYPSELLHADPRIVSSLPLSLSIAYSNDGTQNIRNATSIDGSFAYIPVSNKGLSSANDVWKSIYVFVYGSVLVDDIPNGVYIGDINLIIDYD